MLYGQLGLTEEVMNGTADEKAMLNYWNRTIEPVLTAMVESMRRSFLTKTARTQRQDINSFEIHFVWFRLRTLLRLPTSLLVMKLCLRMRFDKWLVWLHIKIRKLIRLVNSNMPAANPDRPVIAMELSSPAKS